MSSLSRRCRAFWNIFHQQGWMGHVVGWWPSHPVEPIRGSMISNLCHHAVGPPEMPWPVPPGGMHPPELIEEFAALRFNPNELAVEMVEPFIAGIRQIDQAKDPRVGSLMRVLAECVTVHNWGMWLVENTAWDYCCVYYDALDHFGHGFMKYHPPRQEVVSGPGLKQDELLHGASILDVAPTLLTLQGLPVGADMDGRPLLGLWQEPPVVRYLPSWDEVPGEDGRHPAEYRQDPASEKAALDQLVALGYVAAPGADVEQQVADTQREIDFNLAEAWMDGGRNAEAWPILDRLYRENPSEYRYALRLALCCRALGRLEDLRRVVTELDTVQRPAALDARQELDLWRREIHLRREGRRAQDNRGAGDSGRPVPLLTRDERIEIASLRKRASLGLRGIEFLKGVVALEDRKPAEAVRCFESASAELGRRPEIHLQSGQALARMGRWVEARHAFDRALELDPSNPHALTGLARVSLAERRFEEAAGFAMSAVQRLFEYPLAHFILGLALMRLGHVDRAVEAWQTSVRLKPAFWPGHVRFARYFRRRDPDRHAWHREQLERIRASHSDPLSLSPVLQAPAHVAETVEILRVDEFPPMILGLPRPAFDEGVITIVTGLPRSGTSLLMQMLAAGGMTPWTDGVRAADEDNPRGYLEHEAIKDLARDAGCLDGATGKVVLPLLPHLPTRHRYHVLFIERDLDEILASQRVMLERLGTAGAAGEPARLKSAYSRLLRTSRDRLSGHPAIRALRLSHRWLIANPRAGAEALAAFVGRGLDVERMAGAVDPRLHRQKTQAH